MPTRLKDPSFAVAAVLASLFWMGGCVAQDEEEGEPCIDSMCGMGGTGGMGGTAGTGGTGGSFSATIVGQVVDADDTTGLDAVFVRAILGSVGIGSDQTMGGGMFEIDVTQPGNYRACAIGAILSPPRFVSTNCEEEDDQVPVPPSDPVTLSITTGYYMELDPSCGQCSFMQAEGTNIDFDLDYQVWNRSGVLQTTTYIAVGIDEKAQDSHLVGNAGSFRLPTEDATGTASFALTATGGTIYARLLPLGSAEDAEGAYEDGFNGAKDTNYVKIGQIEVP